MEGNARKAEADGEVYTNLALAKAQAESLRVQDAVLAQNKDVLKPHRIEVGKTKTEKWKGALPTSICVAPIPLMDVGKRVPAHRFDEFSRAGRDDRAPSGTGRRRMTFDIRLHRSKPLPEGARDAKLSS